MTQLLHMPHDRWDVKIPEMLTEDHIRMSEVLNRKSHRVLKRYPDGSSQKPQAAAHEAGHIVVAHTLGATINEACLIKLKIFNQVLWGGGTSYDWPSQRVINAMGLVSDGTLQNHEQALNTVAGTLGEYVAGVLLPSSIEDHIIQATAICHMLDDWHQQPRGWMYESVFDLASLALKFNRRQFVAVREHLEKTHHLTRKEAKSLLHGCTLIDFIESFSPPRSTKS